MNKVLIQLSQKIKNPQKIPKIFIKPRIHIPLPQAPIFPPPHQRTPNRLSEFIRLNEQYLLQMSSKCLIILAVLVTTIIAATPCNSTYQYTLTATGACYKQCPWVSPTMYYAYDPDLTCVSSCPSPYFAFSPNRTCLTTCPSSPSLTLYDYSDRECVSVCPQGTYAAGNQSCLGSCPTNTWGYQLNNTCITTCPLGTYYANVTIPLCVTTCPANYYAYPINRQCYIGGSCPTTPVRYYSDDTKGLCVSTCPTGYFADPSIGRCVVTCSNSTFFADSTSGLCVQGCPSGYYRSSVTRSCVKNCSIGYFSDLATGNCTIICSLGSFGEASSGTCKKQCTAPFYADGNIRQCVKICSSGLFSNNYTQSCVLATSCYSNTIGDPTTNQCVTFTSCPTAPYMFADMTNKICRTRCSATTWGDMNTRTCVDSCPWDLSMYVTYANPDTRQCVTSCPAFPIMYADNSTKSCVATCPTTPAVAYRTFADPTTRSCVQECPLGYRADLNKSLCVASCTTYPVIQYFDEISGSCVQQCPEGYFAQLSTKTCVQACSTSPMYFSFDPNNTCLSVCPSGYFGDFSTGTCVEQCPQTTLQFADPSVNLCVDQCPLFPETYGFIDISGFRTCVVNCTNDQFADPASRLCVSFCKLSNGYYGMANTSRCVLQCPSGTFADNSTYLCVEKCPNYPVKMYGDQDLKICGPSCSQYLYSNPINNLCVIATACPTGYFGDSSTRQCVKVCPSSKYTFGEPASRKCVQLCPEGLFADNTTRLCTTTCTSNFYKDPSTKTCVKICPSTPNLYANPFTMICSPICTNNSFALDTIRTCVSICPSTPVMYGDYNTMRCVTGCPREFFIFTNNSFRGCVSTCPKRVYTATYSVTMYADNSTWSCVLLCPVSKNLYNFRHPDTISGICVSTCPMVNQTYYFAQNSTQTCITTCPSTTLATYGDIFTSKCVKNCSRNQFRDNTTSRCVYGCSSGFFADNTTWNCVLKCPVGLFAETINQTCARFCPTGFFADNQTRYCVSLCNSTLYLYSDNTTWKCLPNCSRKPDYYADPNTKLCVKECTGGLFADNFTRSCLPAINCSNSTIGDPQYFRCVPVCPIATPSFFDYDTNLCLQVCPFGQFADNSTMKCTKECPSNPDYFEYNNSYANGTFKQGLCVLFCPVTPIMYYRHAPTRECLTACPGPNYFRDQTTLRCVTKCPAFFYAETIGQICVSNCSANSKYAFRDKCLDICPNNTNADPTTFLCVDTCPFGYFSQNKICVTNCTHGYADPFLKVCVPICSPDYFSYDPQLDCRQDCQPQYKYIDNQTCVSSCPASANVTQNLYMDSTTYSCLHKCLPTWYADNLTRSCTQTCSPVLFADNSTGLCVTKCPQKPDFFGWNQVCYFPCPVQSPVLYAENDTRTCMPTCPPGSFADSYTRRCVAVCTGNQYGFSDAVTSPICVDKCPDPTYGNNLTRKCIARCLNNTYGENTTRLCLQKCPIGTFAETHVNLCVEICNNTIPQFADPSTSFCVVRCPQIPSLYGDFNTSNNIPVCIPSCISNGNFTYNKTRRCVTDCLEPYFADPITGDCAAYCQPNSNLFADNSTRRCTSCPNVTIAGNMTITYADPSTMRCVSKCPFVPSFYGDNSTNRCVSRCPSGSYGQNQTRLCIKTCFFNSIVEGETKFSFADDTTNFCVNNCPQYSWADNYTITCTNNCTEGTFADDSTWRCVAMCPSNPIAYAYSPTRKCIYACPSPYLASEVGRICMLRTCPTIPYFYYKNVDSNQCVLKCVYPLFGEISSQSCVSNCSYGYYNSLGSMTCQRCPSSCLTCINLLNCTTCQAGLYLHQGLCVTSCPSFPVYYYKYDPSFTCITQCPSPYFAFTGTGKCQNSCPIGYFSNITTGQCSTCPTGCSSCYGSECYSCYSDYVFVEKKKSCSKTCSLELPFFLSQSCVSSCAAGTFMLDDLVTCQRCSSICAECSKLATNCTKCTGSFWYSYNCVTKCPDSYYVDRSNTCQQCSSNPTVCALPPLTYTIYFKMEAYVLYGYVEFNRAVDLTASEFSKIAKISTQKGALKASDYKLSKVSPSLYKLTFRDSNSLNELSLSISFAPGSIFDDSGNGLTSISSSTTVPLVTTISTQMKAQTQAISSQVNYMGWILLVVILLMMIKSSYPMVVLLDLLQFIHLHVYVLALPLPYLYMSVLNQFNNVNFAFLSPVYINGKPDTADPYYVFQQDTTFLGNCQPFVFFLAIFGGFFLLFWLLAKRNINRFPTIRKKIKLIFKARMKFSFLHEIFYYTEYYVFFFALYQFGGANGSFEDYTTNLAAAVIVASLYVAWLITITYQAYKYKKRMETVPKRLHFLALQPSQFPMQIPLRGLFKMLVAFALINPLASLQLILLIVFNLVMVIYFLCFNPSKSKISNYLNSFLHIAMILVQIVLFIYSVGDMTSAQQTTISYGIFAIMGISIISVLAWIIYRLITYIREQCFGIKADEVTAEVSVKEKSEKIPKSKRISSQKITLRDKQLQKQMNISQLNIHDQQQSQGQSINADEAIQLFTIHHIPKKSQGLLKHQQAIMGIKEVNKRSNQPMVLQIDEDELIDGNIYKNNSEVSLSLNHEYEKRNKRDRLKSGARMKRAHLKIEGEDSISDLQEFEVIQKKKQQKPIQNKVVDVRSSNRVLWDGDFEELQDV